MDDEPLRALARKCARANLSLRDARALFLALYAADALMLEGGDRRAAAARTKQSIDTLNGRRKAVEDEFE